MYCLGWSSWVLGRGGGDGQWRTRPPAAGTRTATTTPTVSLRCTEIWRPFPYVARNVEMVANIVCAFWYRYHLIKLNALFCSIIRKRKKHGKQQQTSSTEWSGFSIYCPPSRTSWSFVQSGQIKALNWQVQPIYYRMYQNHYYIIIIISEQSCQKLFINLYYCIAFG